MKSILRLAPVACAAGVISLSGISAHATNVEITYENLSQEGGLWNTPLFLGFHNGAFDTADLMVAASASVELLAEEGDPGDLISDIGSVPGAETGVIFGDDAPGVGPGVLFNPGSSNSLVINLDAANNRYLSFASMILPSNDAFIGNLNPTAYDLFNINGDFNDGFAIDIYGFDVWDAGTEENDGNGAPFSMIGVNSTGMDVPSTPTVGGVVTRHLDLDPSQNPGLSNFVGTTLGNGDTLDIGFGAKTRIGRITAQRVPDTAPAAGLMGFLFLLGFHKLVSRRKKTTV